MTSTNWAHLGKYNLLMFITTLEKMHNSNIFTHCCLQRVHSTTSAYKKNCTSFTDWVHEGYNYFYPVLYPYIAHTIHILPCSSLSDFTLLLAYMNIYSPMCSRHVHATVLLAQHLSTRTIRYPVQTGHTQDTPI